MNTADADTDGDLVFGFKPGLRLNDDPSQELRWRSSLFGCCCCCVSVCVVCQH